MISVDYLIKLANNINQKLIQIYQIKSFIKYLVYPIRLPIIYQFETYKIQKFKNSEEIDISTISKQSDSLKKYKITLGKKNNVFYTLNIPCVLEFTACTNKVIN